MRDTVLYDVVIVGGGPAGSTAGRILAGLGYSVLIIDKSNFPRKKLCGGLITEKTLWLVERAFNINRAELLDRGIINFSSSGYEILKREKPLVNENGDVKLDFVDREVYDAFLLQKARASGANVIEGDRVVTCDLEKTEVMTASGAVYSGRFIIGADGVNSVVRKSFPLKNFSRKKWRRCLVSAIEIFIDRSDFDPASEIAHLDRPRIFLSLVNYGYIWMFPRRDRIVAGIGGFHKKNKTVLPDILDRFLSSHGINNHNKYKKWVHGIPCGYSVPRPVYNNAILVGDAGGFVDPLLGEGIFYGQRTAELASWAIHRNITEDRPLGRVYKKLLWKYVLPEFFDARVVRALAYYISEKLNHVPLKVLFLIMGGIFNDVLQGKRSNRLFFKRRIHRAVSLNRVSLFLTRPRRK